MNFEYPLILWLLLCLPLLALKLFYPRKKSANKSASYGFSHLGLVTNLPNSFRQKFLWLVPFLYLLALAAAIVALAQPFAKQRIFSEQAEGIAISMVVDISTSMDFDMNIDGQRQARMEVAKKALKQFVLGDNKKLAGRSNDLISVITFARYPDTLVPLTSAHKALVAMTDEITTTTRPNEDSTAFGDATALAAAQLSHYEQSLGLEENSIKSKIIILLTDGENNSGQYDPLMAAAMAKKWGIKVYTISLGDDESDVVSTNSGSKLNIDHNMTGTDWVLQAMAESTGGTFQRAHDYQSLHSVYQAIDELETSNLQKVLVEKRQPAFHLPTLAALLALILATLLNATWLRRV